MCRGMHQTETASASKIPVENSPQRSVKYPLWILLHIPTGERPGLEEWGSSLFNHPPGIANLRVCWLWEAPLRGRLLDAGLLPYGRAQRAPAWTTIYRVAREWALVIMMFHPGQSLGQHFLSKCENRSVMPLRQEEYFPRLIIRKAEACYQFPGGDSVSDKLRKSWA